MLLGRTRGCSAETEKQLDDLHALDHAPDETIAKNVWYMLRAGVTKGRIREAIALLGECQRSTRCVEHGHGSMACIRKRHPDYTGAVLAARAAIHQQRACFAIAPSTARAAKLELRMRRLARSMPQVSVVAMPSCRTCMLRWGLSASREAGSYPTS